MSVQRSVRGCGTTDKPVGLVRTKLIAYYVNLLFFWFHWDFDIYIIYFSIIISYWFGFVLTKLQHCITNYFFKWFPRVQTISLTSLSLPQRTNFGAGCWRITTSQEPQCISIIYHKAWQRIKASSSKNGGKVGFLIQTRGSLVQRSIPLRQQVTLMPFPNPCLKNIWVDWMESFLIWIQNSITWDDVGCCKYNWFLDNKCKCLQ